MSSDREAILARRRRFIALALAGGAAASTACSPSPCLSDAGRAFDASFDAGIDTGAFPCLSPPPPDVPEDGGVPDAEPDDAGADDAGADDADAGSASDAGENLDGGKPMPCLSPPPADPRE